MNSGDKISAEETLLRRVFAKDKRYVNPKTGKPTSRAFTPRPKDEGKLSVDVKSLTTFAYSILDSDKYSLFTINTHFALNLGLECIYDPINIPNEIVNPAHSLIIGIPVDDESIAGLLARNSSFQPAF